MGGETIASRKSIDTICILVVDDDTTCLSIVAAILKKFNYQVVTVKHPNDALCTLRIKGDTFHLVVSDVHMPDMNGFQLQRAIAREFNLPVVLMSADNKEGVAIKGLESGAAFFISKPVSPDDLRDLWQFAAIKQKSQVVIEETGNYSNESSSAFNQGKRDSKRKLRRKESCDGKKGGNSHLASNKKPKVIWNNSLHNRFLEAIRSIGLDRAVPKKILEVMNVPGLTRENVASHLQKYRIFLRRVSDASYKIHCADNHKGLISRSSGPSFASLGAINRLSKLHNQNTEVFSGSFVAQSGFRQSQLLPSTRNLLKPNIRINADMIQYHKYNPPVSGIFNTINSSETSKDFPNYVGYKISNIKHSAESGSSKDLDTICSNVFKNNNLNAPVDSQMSDHISDGKQLSDVIADYQNLLLPSMQQPLGEGDLSSIFVQQVKTQNQQNEGTSFNLYGGMTHCDQVSNQEDDDFLESLLGPFEEI